MSPAQPSLTQTYGWLMKNTGLDNEWYEQWQKIFVDRPKGTIDTAGATPPDWEPYLSGPDGQGISAQISEPVPEDTIQAFAQGVRITFAFKIRRDIRIKENMQVRWWYEGNYHIGRIHMITNIAGDYHYMNLNIVEGTTQAEEYL